MNNQLNQYSFKLWLTVAATSFIIFQIPLYLFNYVNSRSTPGGYTGVLFEFTKNWFYIMVMLVLTWIFTLRAVRALYQPYWSARGFKLAMLMVSEFLTLFFMILFFCFFNSSYIIPTQFVLVAFVLSTGLSVFLHSYKPLRDEFYRQHQELE